MRKLFLFILLALLNVSADAKHRTVVKGTIKNFQADSIVVFPEYNEWPRDSVIVKPVVGNSFEFIIEDDYVRQYILCVGVSAEWYVRQSVAAFFNDAPLIEIEIYPKVYPSLVRYNKEEGSMYKSREAYNRAEKRFSKRIAQMSGCFFRKYETREYRKGWNRFYRMPLEERSDFRKELLSIPIWKEDWSSQKQSQFNKILQDEERRFTYNYYMTYPDEWVYYMLVKELSIYNRCKYSYKQYLQLFNRLKARHPGYPYEAMVEKNLAAIKRISPGSPIIDFTLPDYEGVEHTLSEEIKGKTTVIFLKDVDYRTETKETDLEDSLLHELFMEYKDRGFNVVRASWEPHSKKGGKLERDDYTWLHLSVGLHHREVFEKYRIGIGSSYRGQMFLIDKKGIIIQSDISIDDLERYLKRKYGRR